MKLNVVPVEIDSLSFSGDENPRSEGLHLSTILSDLESTLDPSRRGESTTFSLPACAATGFLWERMLKEHWIKAQAEAGLIFLPGEQEKDGVYMTPDGIDCSGVLYPGSELDPKQGILEEYKATWKSMNRDPRTFRYFIWQIKSYCHVLELTQARIRPLFMNGNWKDKLGPHHDVVWEFQFTPRELEKNWNMVLQHAKDRGWL